MRSSVEIALALVLGAHGAWAQGRCEACHAALRDPRLRDPAVAVESSVHRGPLVGCVGCHGGRGADASAGAHDPAAGFVPRPTGMIAVGRCGTCHADARFVRQASATLQVDQRALFQADPHGRAVAEGRPRAPTCATCHGAHDVRSRTEQASPVNPSRVGDTCGRCHEGPAAVRGPLRADESPAAWRTSVHGRALLEAHNPRAPGCPNCHGAHGEYRLAGGAGARCGPCHLEEAQAAARSPHAETFARLGFGPCAPCHGSHAVREANGALLGAGASAVCERCHSGAQRAQRVATHVARLRAQALSALDSAEDALREADRADLVLPDARARAEEALAARRRLDVALHALDQPGVEAAASEVRRAAGASQDTVRRTLARRERQRRGWIPTVGLFAALAVLLALRSWGGGPR